MRAVLEMIGALILVPIAVAIIAIAGNIVGHLLALIPMLGDALTVGTFEAPELMTWAFVVAYLVGVFTND